MKKAVLVIGAILFVCTLAFGKAGFQPGICAGLNLANLNYSEDLGDGYEQSSRLGLSAGAMLDIGVNNMLSVETGLYYTMKGGKKTNKYGGEFHRDEVETITALDYLTIPIKLKARFGPKDIKPFVTAGPEVGLLLSAKSKNDEDIDIKDDMEAVDFGLVFGAGIDLLMGEKILSIQVNYNLGLMDIQKDGDSTDEVDVTVKNTGIYILAAFRLMM
ncbi:PorT family protein [bacterium]|nr:PorT family protein [bacterium]